jgi:hypothetical protein
MRRLCDIPARNPCLAAPGFDAALLQRIEELAGLNSTVVPLIGLQDRINALQNGTVDWVVGGEHASLLWHLLLGWRGLAGCLQVLQGELVWEVVPAHLQHLGFTHSRLCFLLQPSLSTHSVPSRWILWCPTTTP